MHPSKAITDIDDKRRTTFTGSFRFYEDSARKLVYCINSGGMANAVYFQTLRQAQKYAREQTLKPLWRVQFALAWALLVGSVFGILPPFVK